MSARTLPEWSKWALRVHTTYPHVPQPMRTHPLDVMSIYDSSWTSYGFFGHFHNMRRHAHARAPDRLRVRAGPQGSALSGTGQAPHRRTKIWTFLSQFRPFWAKGTTNCRKPAGSLSGGRDPFSRMKDTKISGRELRFHSL